MFKKTIKKMFNNNNDIATQNIVDIFCNLENDLKFVFDKSDISISYDHKNQFTIGYIQNDTVFIIRDFNNGSWIIHFYLFTPPDLVVRLLKTINAHINVYPGKSFYSASLKNKEVLKLNFIDFSNDCKTFSFFIAESLADKLKEDINQVN